MLVMIVLKCKELNMKIYKTNDFNIVYLHLLKDLLNRPMYKITNRKGETLHEITNFNLVLSNLDNCYCFCRNLNLHYLIGETLFYLKGENKLKNIENYSKFWKSISDDGETLNSCYGYYIFKQVIANNGNQFGYCIEQLVKNPDSKKAVITIYSAENHSKETKDNPCTMFLQFYIRENKLYLKTHMRSNDIWFGLPYDLPFFVMLQKAMLFKLNSCFSNEKLTLGDYVHSSNSLHLYERNFEEVKEIIKNPFACINMPVYTTNSINNLENLIDFESSLSNHYLENLGFLKTSFHDLNDPYLNYCRNVLVNFSIFKALSKYANEYATCLKKKVASAFYSVNGGFIVAGYCGRPEVMGPCKECVRKTEEFFQDGCNSIHSEERAILTLAKEGGSVNLLKNSTCYLTHAPCDQCLKFMIEVGVKKVIFKEAYKTHFARYKGIIEIEDGFGRKYA
jgi:thymidylate synthase